MTSFTGQVLLESVLVPAIVSGLIVFPARWLSHRVFHAAVQATAFMVAIAVTYVMIFGWPIAPALGARQKIFLLTFASLLLGMGLNFGTSLPYRLLAALSILGPLWIGWPALMQGRPSAILLVLPMIVGLWVHDRSMRPANGSVELSLLLIMMALGLALIALFARTLSSTQLGLALASTLAAALLTGPKPPERVLSIAGATMLSGLLTALLLYSDASLPAIIVLGCILASPRLADFLSDPAAVQPSRWLSLLIATILATAAVTIAWIDAGSIPVY